MAPPKGSTPKTPKLTPRRTNTPKSSARKRKEVEEKPKKEVALFSSEEDDKSVDGDKEIDKSFTPPSPHSPRGRRSSGGSSGKGRLVDLSMYGEDELQRDRNEVFALHTSYDSGKSFNDSKCKELPKESEKKENQLEKSVVEAEISQMSKDLDEFEDFELTIEYKKVERVKDKNKKESAKDDYLDNNDEKLFGVERDSKDDRGDASSLDVNFSRTTNRTVSTPKSIKTPSEFDSIYSPSDPLSAIENSVFGHSDWSDISMLDSTKSTSNRRGSKVETPHSSLKRSLPLSTSTPLSALRPAKQRRK